MLRTELGEATRAVCHLGERRWRDPGKELSRCGVPGNIDASLGRHLGTGRGGGRVPGGEMREKVLLG